jgi:hypothetical protein
MSYLLFVVSLTCRYLLEGDAGDHTRMFIGGKGSLYRIAEYKGLWYEDERHGLGACGVELFVSIYEYPCLSALFSFLIS